MKEREWGWQARGGLRVYAREWTPEDSAEAVPVRAVAALVHGMGEHSGRYRHVAKALAELGIATLTFDQLGHGRTEGKRGHAGSYDELLAGIDRLLEEAGRRFPGLPVFLYGHSMGGNLTLNYLLRRKPDVTGAIATGPWLKLAFEPAAVKVVAARLMERIYPKYTDNHPLEPTHLTSDPQMLAELRDDNLGHAQITAKFFLGIHRAGRFALEHATELAVPLLLMHGGDDRVTSSAASRLFAERAGPLCTFREWPGFRHELHNERQREEVFKTILDWIRNVLEGNGKLT